MSTTERTMFLLKKNRAALLAALIFLAYTLLSFSFYLERTLEGRIDNHILAGEMFGTPKELQERGIKPLYRGAGQTGWDGQFYYYMANDILARKDTASHIDAPSYRYQRVGLSLYTAAIAKILGEDWVSPTTFFLSYLFLILAATLAGAFLYSKLGLPPALILLWSLSVGTQITLFNALPDAAADAFLILALSALYAKRYTLASIPFIFSALSREVYVLFPSFALLFLLVNSVSNIYSSGNGFLRKAASHLLKWKNYYPLAFPGVAAVLWHIYVVRHFGVSPSEQAAGILGQPLSAWIDYFSSGINNNHKLVGPGIYAYAEVASLVLFLLVLVLALWISVLTLVKIRTKMPEMRGIALTSACFVVLYACFGPTVIMHYSGYFKAAAVFFFLIPLLLAITDASAKNRTIAFLTLFIALSVTTIYNMDVRILPFSASEDKYTKISSVTETQRIECFNKYEAEVKIESMELIKGSRLSSLFGRGDLILLRTELKNTGEHPFISTKNFGSVYMSYHWVDENGKVVMDGIRSAIPGTLLPGQSSKISIISQIPKGSGNIHLRPSPVQEGCAWFYAANPNISKSFQPGIPPN